MKKIALFLFITGFATILLSACASEKGRGCPTTNPRYFRG